jgi:hypothetical protein
MHTFTAGEVVTPSNLNNNTVSAFAFSSAPPLAVLRQTVLQTSLSGWASVLFDTEDEDSDGGHSTVTNTSRYTAQTAGWYDLTASMQCLSSSASAVVVQMAFKTNGSTSFLAGKTGGYVSSSIACAPTAVATRFLNVGDYVEVGIQATSGTITLNALASGGDCFPTFNIGWIHT